MLVVVEGPDGSGKTTLLDHVEERLDGEVTRLHFGQNTPGEDVFAKYTAPFLNYRPGDGKHILVDRLHWGELIYGPRYRGESLLTQAQFDWIEMFLASRGAVRIRTTADPITLRERALGRGENFIKTNVEEFAWLDAEFKRVHSLALDLRLRYCRLVDTSYLEPQSAADLVYLAGLKAEAEQQPFPGTSYVGGRYPQPLLVGDAPNVPKNASRLYAGPEGPAFGPYTGTSAEYLLNVLRDHQIFGVGMINSVALPEDMLRWFPPESTSVVALGLKASGRLERLGITHGAVPHPQYWRRFHHNKRDEYAQLILEAASAGPR